MNPVLPPAFVAALRDCNDAAELIAWHGGTGPDAICGLAWNVEPITVASFADLRHVVVAEPRQGDFFRGLKPGDDQVPERGWDTFRWGAWFQLDYEFPARPGRAWRIHDRWNWKIPDLRGRKASGDPDRDLLDFATTMSTALPPPFGPVRAESLQPAWDRAGHRRRVEDIRARIASGEIYQANLTLPFSAPLRPYERGADIGTFLALVGKSPGGYAVMMRGGGRTVISHSPECLLRSRSSRGGIHFTSLPIKGTRRRVPGREAEIRKELIESAKDRAELAMIVDLVRNDLGRVAAPGSVRVVAGAALLDLPHLHHLVAPVVAQAREGYDALDALAALFPAGSIIGAPKLRAQQVLRELEAGARGPYCGAFGWMARGIGECISEANVAVAIRTLVIEGNTATLHAGGGIVADSDPDREWEEACAKASGMAAALGVTLRADAS